MRQGLSTYAHEKLLVAVDSLATGPGDVRERLLHAYLSFPMLSESNFPTHLRKDWRWFIDQMTRYGPLEDHNGKVRCGSVENTMRRIRRSTGVKIAQKLVFLHHELEFYFAEQTRKPS